MTIVRPSLVIAALLAASPVHAQVVEAEALFRDAKDLLKQGKIAEACTKFDASDRLDPSVGTELNAADCHEKNKKLATAWATFLKAASNAAKAGNDKQREAEARRRASLLQPRLSYLTISVPETSKVTGLVIKRGNDPIDPALWNTGIPVDIGDYEVSGQAPGHEAWSTKVAITAEGEKKSIEVPRFKEIEALITKPVDPVTGPTGPTGPTPETRDQPGTFTPMRKAAIGVAAVGLVGIGGMVFFGTRANSLQSEADALCPMAPACGNPTGLQKNEDARQAALLSNISLGVGIAGIGGAVALWFLGAPESITVAPTTNGRDVAIMFGGSF